MFKLFKSLIKSIARAIYQDEEVQKLSKKYPKTFHFFKGRLTTGKKFGLYLTIGVTIATIFGLLFFSFIEDVRNQESLVQADERIINLVETIRSPALNKIMLATTYLANWQIVFLGAIFITAILIRLKKLRHVKMILISVLGGEIFVWITKNIIQRPRPEMVDALLHESSYSFPSGHAFVALSFYGLSAYFISRSIKKKRKKIIVLLLGAIVVCAIGFSRIYLGVHWPSDILASFVSGIAFLAILISTFEIGEKFEPSQESKKNQNGKETVLISIIFLVLWISFIFYFYQTHPVKTIEETNLQIIKLTDAQIISNIFDKVPKTSEDLKGNPIEPINIILIGNESKVKQTFIEAGWTQCDRINLKSTFKSAYATFFHKPYPQAPGTPSFWNAHPNDFAFEKSTEKNSIAERHHIHFWKTQFMTENGKQVWFATAHFDKSIKLKSSVIFPIHIIDPFVDKEREKVKNDLQSTNKVQKTQEINVTQQTLGQNAAGNTFYTDGKGYVIFLN